MYQDTGGTLHRIGKNNHKTQKQTKNRKCMEYPTISQAYNLHLLFLTEMRADF